jgi:hypothetical protein
MAAHLNRPVTGVSNNHSRHGSASIQLNVAAGENVFSWMHVSSLLNPIVLTESDRES